MVVHKLVLAFLFKRLRAIDTFTRINNIQLSILVLLAPNAIIDSNECIYCFRGLFSNLLILLQILPSPEFIKKRFPIFLPIAMTNRPSPYQARLDKCIICVRIVILPSDHPLNMLQLHTSPDDTRMYLFTENVYLWEL
jgi:hypothetical protein